MILSIFDKSGRRLIYGQVYSMALKADSNDIQYTLTKIHKPCILEEDRQFCACDEKP